MIFSVYDHAAKKYRYYEGSGTTPPHGWFRKASPGQLRQPEEIAAKLPDDARYIGTDALPQGVIATDLPGVGTSDVDASAGGKETGLGQLTAFQRPLPSARTRAQPNPWDSTDSRGYTKR